MTNDERLNNMADVVNKHSKTLKHMAEIITRQRDAITALQTKIDALKLIVTNSGDTRGDNFMKEFLNGISKK